MLAVLDENDITEIIMKLGLNMDLGPCIAYILGTLVLGSNSSYIERGPCTREV